MEFVHTAFGVLSQLIGVQFYPEPELPLGTERHIVVFPLVETRTGRLLISR